MFVFTCHLPRRRLAAGILAAAVLAGAVVTGTVTRCGSARTVSASASQASQVRSNEDRIAYLESFGWTVEPDPVSCEEILIPETFDASYNDYLALQSGQGFDLTQYAGKRVKRYVYAVTNYPTGEENIQAGLLVYRNTVIGGEVLSASADGFMHALAYPDTAPAS